jgi:hypothetical protein
VVFDPFVKDFSNTEWAGQGWKLFYPDLIGDVIPTRRPIEEAILFRLIIL